MIIDFQRGFAQTSLMLLRRCGYGAESNRRTGETSFVRHLGRLEFPRFHVYVNRESASELILNLHLDAKKPSYEGSHAHSGEYEGDLVEQEAARIRSAFQSA